MPTSTSWRFRSQSPQRSALALVTLDLSLWPTALTHFHGCSGGGLQIATFWSTSRNELWVKGLTSGDYLELAEIRVNCEQSEHGHIADSSTAALKRTCCSFVMLLLPAPVLRLRAWVRSIGPAVGVADSLLYLVRPKAGGVCHTKNPAGETRTTCYYRTLAADGSLQKIMD